MSRDVNSGIRIVFIVAKHVRKNKILHKRVEHTTQHITTNLFLLK